MKHWLTFMEEGQDGQEAVQGCGSQDFLNCQARDG